jgi:hypothetical protein
LWKSTAGNIARSIIVSRVLSIDRGSKSESFRSTSARALTILVNLSISGKNLPANHANHANFSDR